MDDNLFDTVKGLPDGIASNTLLIMRQSKKNALYLLIWSLNRRSLDGAY